MSRKKQLFDKLKDAPTDRTALDNLVGFFARRGEFQELYEGLQEMVEGLSDRGTFEAFRKKLVDITRRHLDSTTDTVLAANLKLRLAGLLFEQMGETRDALILVTEAFEQIPSDEVAQRALDMLKKMKMPLFEVQLLRQKALSEEGSDKKADTLLQLGHAALSCGKVHEGRKAFEELSLYSEAWAEKGQEGLKLVDNAETEISQGIAELEKAIPEATDVERPLLKQKLGQLYVSRGEFDEGIALLEEVVDHESSDDGIIELVSAYKESEHWQRLINLCEQFADQVKSKEVRKELYKERVRVFVQRFEDRDRGFAALEELYSRFPGVSDVVEFCAQTYSSYEDFEGLAELLGRARRDTKNRDQERRYLEWEASIRWDKLDQLDDAEKLYRRIKSIDPRNEAALLFYEKFCLEKGDFRKLYSTLSTRQSLVPDNQKVAILKNMSGIARDHLNSPDRAIDSLKKVLVLLPEDEAAFTDLATLLEETRRWHAVIELYTSRAERLPDEAADEKLELLRKTLDIYSSKDKLPVPEMVVTVYRKILQIDPQNGEALDALGDYYQSNRRWSELTDVLEKKAEAESDSSRKMTLHREIAEILIEYQHQEGAAIPHLEQVVELAPDDNQAMGLLARAYRSRGEFEKFFEIGQRQLAMVQGKERTELLEELSTIALERLQADEDAADLLEQLVASAPAHPWAFRRLSQLYNKLERFDELADLLTRGVEKASTANQKREMREKLGQVLAERLGRFDEARTIFLELLEENPTNRQAKQSLHRLLAQAGEFSELEDLFTQDNNLPGLVRFLDEYRHKESDLDRVKAAGLEMVRISDHLLNDKSRARQLLEKLLEQLPDDPEVARTLLGYYPKKQADMDVARALGVIADNTEGPEAREATYKLSQVLELIGEFDPSYTRTLGLFLEDVRGGDLDLLESLIDRAEKADALEDFSLVVVELLEEDLDASVRVELAIQVADVHKSRLKDQGRARELLQSQLEHEPGSVELLKELEKLYTGAGNWTELEGTVRALADLAMDVDDKKEELFKLARLYEEITTDQEKAVAVYEEIRENAPGDSEAYAGLKRMLEELEQWEEMAQVLEDELQFADDEQARENLLQLASLHDDQLANAEAAASFWQQVVERWPDDSDAWGELERYFAADEALELVLPLLEARHEGAEAWTELVEVLSKKSQVSEDEMERFDTLGRCAEILAEKLSNPAEAFGFLTHMVTINPSEPDLLGRLETTGRQGDKLNELMDIYKGLLSIGDSDFAAAEPFDEGLEMDAALSLAGLARELDDNEIAVDALMRARVHAPSDLAIFQQLEELLEQQERHEELFELLVEKKDAVWEEEDKKELYVRVADLLTNKLDREDESIEWVELLQAMDEADLEVAERLENLYQKYEKWDDVASLLRSKLARLDGEERRAVALQLAIVYRDNLTDLESAYEILSEIVAQNDSDEMCIDALSFMLKMTEIDGYESVALKVASVLEPIATERENWQLLCDVLEVRAAMAPEAVDAATAWHEIGCLYRDQLDDMNQAFEAMARGVEQAPGMEALLADLLSAAEELDRTGEAIAAIEKGMGGIEAADDVAPLAALAATVRKHTDDLEKAALAYERLMELAPENLEYYWALDELYEQSDNAEGRVRVLGEVADRLEGREQADVSVTLAELQMGRQEREDAVFSLNRALTNPDLLDEDRRALAFHLLVDALETEENWFDLSQALMAQLQFVDNADEKKALLFRTAALEEEQLSNPERAIEHYYSIVDADPTEDTATEALYRLLEATSRFEQLEELLAGQAELTDSFESKKELLLRLAKVRLFELSNPDRAVDALGRMADEEGIGEPEVELLEQVLESFPDSGFRASQLLEQAYERNSEHEKLAEIYRTQIDRYAEELDRVERYRDLASLYETHFSDVDTAFLYISQAFKLEPTSEAIHEQLVQYARERGSFDELFDIYLDVLVQLEDPENRNNLRTKMVGIYHDELTDLEHAEVIYRDMLDDDPGHSFAIEKLQELYRETETWDKLVDVLRTSADATRSDKARIATLYEIAAIYRESTGDLAEAMDTYEQILGTDRTQWDAYRGIESIYFEKGDVQGVIACLRREISAREDPAERREVQLRLAAIQFTELQEYDPAVEEIANILAEEPEGEGALELLREIVDQWEDPSQPAIELLVAAHTGKEEWDTLVGLYQSLAGRAEGQEEKQEWLAQIYEVRTTRQNDPTGAYAACKIMVALDPTDGERLNLLVQHAVEIDDVPDLVSFLEQTLGDDRIAGTDLEPELRFLLGSVLQGHTDDNQGAADQFEKVAESEHPTLAPDARRLLRNLYPELESWDQYVALLETLSADAPDPMERKQLLLEAGDVAAETLNDDGKALALFATLSDEFPDDAECLDPYEQILTRLKRAEDLESLLRQRVDMTADEEARAAVRLRLGSLVLSQEDRTTEGVDELLMALEETRELPVLWTILESLMGSDDSPEDDRIRIARALLAAYPEETDAARVSAALETQLALEEDEDESNRLHLQLAELHEGGEGAEKAFFHLSQSLRLYPGVKKVEKRLRKLAQKASLHEGQRDLLVDLVELVDDETLKVRYLLEAAGLERSELASADSAAALYERALDLDPSNKTALGELESYYRAGRQFEKLSSVLENQIRIEEDPEVRLDKTIALAELCGEQLNDPDGARQWWEELQHEPRARAKACAHLEEIYAEQQEWDLLSDLLLQQREEAESEADQKLVMVKLAGLYEQRLDNLEEAFHWYGELLQLEPESGAALQGAKRCSIQLEDWETVARVDTTLLETAEGEDAAALQKELASILIERLGEKEQGLQHLQTLLQADTVDPEVKELALSQISDPDVGFQVSLTLEPVLEQDAEWDKLSELYESQIGVVEEPEERVPIALKAAEVLSERLDRSDHAFTVLADVLEDVPGSRPVSDKLLELAEAGGDWTAYVEVIQRAYENAGEPEELIALATLVANAQAERLDDADAAFDWYRRVFEEDPTNADTITAVEKLLEAGERYEDLASFYEDMVLNFDGEERLPFLLKLGFTREGQLDDPAGAVQAYREVLSISPESTAALGRLDAMLDNPILGLAAVEILEPIYRSRGDDDGLARVLVVKSSEVEGSLDRADLLAEAAQLMAKKEGNEQAAFDTYMQAIKQKRFDTSDTLSSVEELAQKLDRWQDLANVLEQVAAEAEPGDLKVELLRRLSLIYLEKISAPSLAELKLQEILADDPNNGFALNMLSQVLQNQGEAGQQIEVLEKLGDIALDADQKKTNYVKAAGLALDADNAEEASRFYDKALQVAPDDLEIIDLLADLYRRREAWKDLVELLETKSGVLEGDDALDALLDAAHIARESMQAPSRALALCRLMLDRDETNLSALRMMTEILQGQGKLQEQIVALEKLADLEAGDEQVETLWKLHALSLEMNDTEGAIGYVGKVLEIDPKNARAIEAKIELLRGGEDLYNLVTTFEEQAKIAEEPEKKAELLYEAATTLADEIGELTSALERLNEIQELVPEHTQSVQKSAQIYIQQQAYPEAVTAFEKLAEMQVDSDHQAGALRAAARLSLQHLSEPDRARELAAQALEMNEDDGEAFDLLSSALDEEENYEELVQQLLARVKKVEDADEKAALCKRLAMVYRDGLDNEDLFLNWTEEAHKTKEDPELVDEMLAHYRNADSLERVAPLLEWKIGHLAKRRQQKEIPALQYELGSILNRLGEKDKALEVLQKCVDADGSFLAAIYSIAMLLFELDRKEEALPSYQTLLLRINELESKEQKVSVYLNLAKAHLDKGDHKRAKTYLSRLLSIDRKHAEAKELLGNLS